MARTLIGKHFLVLSTISSFPILIPLFSSFHICCNLSLFTCYIILRKSGASNNNILHISTLVKFYLYLKHSTDIRDNCLGIDSTHGSLALKAYQQNLYLEYYY